MVDEATMRKAVEDAARAVHEHYRGDGSWAEADTRARSAARHAVRLMLSAFAKNGVEPAQGAPRKPGAASKSERPLW